MIDACRMPSLGMVTVLPAIAIDLRSKDAASPLRIRCRELQTAYMGYEELLPYLTQSAYDILMK